MFDHSLAKCQADLQARLQAARRALSRHHSDGLISPDMSIEETIEAYRQRLATKGLGQKVGHSDFTTPTPLGWFRHNWVFSLLTLICFVLTSVGSVFFMQSSMAACTPIANLVSGPSGTLPANTEAFTTINTAMGTPFSVSGFTNVRATVSVNSGNVKITATSGLTAPSGYASADWTSGSASTIAFEGSQTDVNAALLTLAYKGTAATVTVAASPVDVAYNPTNGNYYLHVAVDADAATSRADALSRELYQCNFGYLATITSASEQAFIESYLTPINMGAFFGGSDEDTEGTWKWLDGPEAGQVFWIGDYNTGSAQGGAYTNWNMITNQEPRISNGENRVALAPLRGWRWADVGTTGAYLIEWTGGQLMEASMATSTSGAPSLSLADISKYTNDADFTITDPTSLSSGAFSYTSSDTSVATISGNTVSIQGVGATTITVTQAANGSYSSGTTTATLTVSKVPVTLTLANINKLVTDADFAITNPASSSSGAFTYTSSDTSVATISGNTVSIQGVGTSTISVSQAETATYAAGSTTATLTVSLDTGSISLADISKLTTDTPFTISNPASSSTGAFTYTSSDASVATISGNTVTIQGAGTSTITVNQASDSSYAAMSATATLTVSKNQVTLSLTDISKLTTDTPFLLVDPTSASSGAFSYTSSDASVATISGNMVTIQGAGTSTITVTQAADATYLAAFTTATLTVVGDLSVLPQNRYEEVRQDVQVLLNTQLRSSLLRRARGSLYLLREKMDFHRNVLTNRSKVPSQTKPFVSFNASGDEHNHNLDGRLYLTSLTGNNFRKKILIDVKKISGKNSLNSSDVRVTYLSDHNLSGDTSQQFHAGIDLAKSTTKGTLASETETNSVNIGASISKAISNSLHLGGYIDFGFNRLRGKFANQVVSVDTRMDTYNYVFGGELIGRGILSPTLTLEPGLSVSHGKEKLLGTSFKASNKYGSADVTALIALPEETKFSFKPELKYLSYGDVSGKRSYYSVAPTYGCETVKTDTKQKECDFGFSLKFGHLNQLMKSEAEASFTYESLTQGPMREYGLRYKMKF